uniref:uncharacterized protein LOC122610251 n=1 Tax=Erigeron canadensis TaxID=72917 RepID=UPI001CB908E6|nr:uncharacterized protein LOC122610251 [Erigeron canadensis]
MQGTRIQATVKHGLMQQYDALLEEGGPCSVKVRCSGKPRYVPVDTTPFQNSLLPLHSGMKIKCALWGEHATKLDAFLSNPERNDGRVIMPVQFAKLGKCDRMYITERYVTPNYKGGSKVWIDEDLPAFAEFTERLFSINVAPNTRRFLSSTSVYLSDDYWEQFQFKNIDELMDIKEAIGCIVVGTIINIDTEKGWFYYACSKCTKKVDRLDQPLHDNTDHEGIASFVCGKCGFITDVYPKILVQVRVQDTTGNISLAIRERDVTGYIHKPASNFITNATNGEHSKMFPVYFNVFLEKRFAWRINISKYNIENKSDLYTVDKFSDNVSVIEAILHKAAGAKDGSSDVDLQVLNELPSTIGLNREDVVFGTSNTARTASSSGSKKVVEHEDDVHKMKVPKLQK